MNAPTDRHTEIMELLPDHAVGALEGRDLDRVEAHLASCAACRAELVDLLELVGVLSSVPTPSRRLPDALPPQRAAGPVSLPTASSAPVSLRAVRASRAWVAVAAAVVLLTVGGLWAWDQIGQRQERIDDQQAIIALLADPGAAYPLTDAEVETGATATFHTDLERGVLAGQGFPSLPDDERYQIWLFTPEGERVDGGLFRPGADGSALVEIGVAEPLSDFWAVGVSVEPAEGSADPTSPLIIGGWIQ